MAPKDGLEQPTTGEEGEEPFDEELFAEADEVDRTPVAFSNSDEFATSRCQLSIVAYFLKKS